MYIQVFVFRIKLCLIPQLHLEFTTAQTSYPNYISFVRWQRTYWVLASLFYSGCMWRCIVFLFLQSMCKKSHVFLKEHIGLFDEEEVKNHFQRHSRVSLAWPLTESVVVLTLTECSCSCFLKRSEVRGEGGGVSSSW